jgi:hypothetical protein
MWELVLEIGVMILCAVAGFVTGWVWCWSRHDEPLRVGFDPDPVRVPELRRVA